MRKRDEWDPVTTTTDGGVVWRHYGDRKIVVANRGEPPNDALERQSAQKRRSRKKAGKETPMKNDETVDAKFARIADEIRTNADWRALLAGTYRDELLALEEIAKRYGGQNWHTGGGVYVAVLPLGPHDCMGVTGEVICHYHNAKATSMSEVFDEPENDTSEGMVSLIE